MHKVIRFAPLLLLAALFGCGGSTGGGGSGSAPQITSFTANPGSITAAGQAVTLSWTVTSGVTGLEIDGGVGPVSGTSTVVYPAGPTVYTLTASNSSGSDDATAEVTLGAGGGPLVEDGLPPSGLFGVSLTPSDFQSDQTGEISLPSDERIVRVAPGGSFYALVSYSDPGGVAGVNIFIANSSPPGLRADLVQGQEVGGFTLVGEVGGCVLDGTQTTVNCIYQIAVGDIPNITALPGAGSEFAYVFRTRVTDVAGNVSDTPPRGYVIVGASSGGGDGGGGGTPTNRDPVASFTNPQTASDSTGVSYRFSAAGSTDPDGDTLSYTWTFGDGTGASSRDHTKKYTADGRYTVRLTVSDGKGGSDTEMKTVAVDVPGGGGGGVTAPTITNFTASPTSITSGQSATLSWAISGTATEVTISPSVGNVTADPDKKVTVTPTTTTTYTISAKNGTASASPKTVKVVVEAESSPPTTGKPLIDSFVSDASGSVRYREYVYLSWELSGGEPTNVTLSTGEGEILSANLVDERFFEVRPEKATTYILEASNTSGKSTETVRVIVKPTVTSFKASPANISSGDSSRLRWTLAGPTPTKLVLVAPDGEKDVTGTLEATVSPTKTTLYTLRAEGAEGSDSVETRVVVAPVINKFQPTKNPVAVNSSVTFEWEVSGADGGSVQLFGPTINTIVEYIYEDEYEGSYVVAMPSTPGTYRYFLVIRYSGGEVRKFFDITVQ